MRVGHGEESLKESLKAKPLEDESPAKVNNKADDDYSIAEQHETGAFNIFSIHSVALFRKKFFMYKRNYKSLVFEVLMPILLVIIGFAFTKVTFFPDSPDRELVISQFPLN